MINLKIHNHHEELNGQVEHNRENREFMFCNEPSPRININTHIIEAQMTDNFCQKLIKQLKELASRSPSERKKLNSYLIRDGLLYQESSNSNTI